jgi:CDP-diglyceride synthetase
MCDRFPCITRSIIPAPTDPIHSRLHLDIINLVVKILTNSNNLFGNPLYWTIFLLCKCIPALIKVGRHGSQSIHFCPLSQIKVGSFCFSAPVRRAGCGGLLVNTDCVRWWWYWSALLCVTAAFAAFLISTFSRHCPENTWRISLKIQFFYPFFFVGNSQLSR